MGEFAALVLFGALNLLALGLGMILARPRRAKRSTPLAVPLDCDVRFPSGPRGASVPPVAAALLFVLFELALVLLLPWALAFRSLGTQATWVALPVLAALGSGLAYAWLRGGFEWE